MKNVFLAFILIIIFATGCSDKQDSNLSVESSAINESKLIETHTENKIDIADDKTTVKERSVHEIELVEFFQGINGCAVIYDENKYEYHIYDSNLAEKRTSPCSTFKIISALIGLKSDGLVLETNNLLWNGTIYPIEEWNQDLGLKQAFQSSCVWYFRDIINKAGKDSVQQLLDELQYGNCDISQWEGSGANEGYDELNGFWLESSLLISPKEQVDVLINIFSDTAKAYANFVPALKEIMLIDNSDIKIFGKTGTGKKESENINAWFVGFAEKENAKYYFAIRLDTANNDVSGQNAKEIAINVINYYLK